MQWSRLPIVFKHNPRPSFCFVPMNFMQPPNFDHCLLLWHLYCMLFVLFMHSYKGENHQYYEKNTKPKIQKQNCGSSSPSSSNSHQGNPIITSNVYLQYDRHHHHHQQMPSGQRTTILQPPSSHALRATRISQNIALQHHCDLGIL